MPPAGCSANASSWSDPRRFGKTPRALLLSRPNEVAGAGEVEGDLAEVRVLAAKDDLLRARGDNLSLEDASDRYDVRLWPKTRRIFSEKGRVGHDLLGSSVVGTPKAAKTFSSSSRGAATPLALRHATWPSGRTSTAPSSSIP